MTLQVYGTGYISSNITGKEYVKANGEKIFYTTFQLSNYNYTDTKTRVKKYSKYLCRIIGEYGKIVLDNFVKGQKIFIKGSIQQENIKKDDGTYTGITTLTIDKIEFMANPKDENYENTDINQNIEDSVINNNENIKDDEIYN